MTDVIAVDQLGIAATLANTLFIGVGGAVALTGGLAFGLGRREQAPQLLVGLSEHRAVQTRAGRPSG